MFNNVNENRIEYFKNNEKRAVIDIFNGISKPYRAGYLGNGYLPDKIGSYKTLEGAKKAVEKYVENFDKTHIKLNSHTKIIDLITL